VLGGERKIGFKDARRTVDATVRKMEHAPVRPAVQSIATVVGAEL
jgi:hypothetical protein